MSNWVAWYGDNSSETRHSDWILFEDLELFSNVKSKKKIRYFYS